jgi:hypothetical protein
MPPLSPYATMVIPYPGVATTSPPFRIMASWTEVVDKTAEFLKKAFVKPK